MTAIEFDHISKQYLLGKIGTGTLSKDLNRWRHSETKMEAKFYNILAQ